jgi:putative membrane protein
MLTEADHQRINSAIEKIEQKTSGDIYCIVAHEASNYREVPLAWAAIVALLVPPLALAAGLPALFAGDAWRAAQGAGGSRDVMEALTVWALAQAVLFALTALVTAVPAVRRLVTPAFLKRHRVGSLAQRLFASTGLHLLPGQPHVLIFLALAERRVEILADAAVHQAAGGKVWNDATAALTAGMREPDPTAGIVRAIEIAGRALVDHFPATRQGQHQDGVAEI